MAFQQPELSAPGVYVQEVPAGKHQITGVPTSITAFLGRTARGPINLPTIVRSFGEFVSTFGNLSAANPLTHAVQDFFNNGGTQAMIVRLFEGAATQAIAGIAPTSDRANLALQEAEKALVVAEEAVKKAGKNKQALADATNARDSAKGILAEKRAEIAVVTSGTALELMAANPGTWGNRLSYATNTNGITAMVKERFANEDWDAEDLFNLTLFRDLGNGRCDKETYANISLNPASGARNLLHILEHQSGLARICSGKAVKQNGSDSKPLSAETYLEGIDLLERVDIFNLLCIPGDHLDTDTTPTVYAAAAALCEKRHAMLIVDAPVAWEDDPSSVTPEKFSSDIGISAASTAARHAAVYFPRIVRPDPSRGGFPAKFPACGAVAGIMARTDASRGLWKAPAGLEAGVLGATGVSYIVADHESGHLNKQGVNCIRSFGSSGPVLWGARTMRGSDQLSDDFMYIPLRRLADFIEETLKRNTKWAVFEPNAEQLWSTLRLTITGFMRSLFRQGAFAGGAGDAYFVQCDASTTSGDDIDKGIVNIVVGYAPLKPAEFIVLYVQQMSGGE
ncbi:MAG: phage tail sheath family protein [Proteobacteria bacterium]|jgi:uncharacterized protein|nr:phage tail sheath family protein [Pseudomonadota bacterium]